MIMGLKGGWLIVITGLFIPLLQVWPLPISLNVWRPLFPVLFIGFWAYILPGQIGALIGFAYGLLVEFLLGSPLMQFALPCALLALCIEMLYLKLRSFSLVQQSLYVGVLIFVILLVTYPLSQQALGVSVWSIAWRSAVSSIIIWVALILWFEPMARKSIFSLDA